MESSLSKSVKQDTKSRIIVWLSSENSLLTIIMEGIVTTNAKMLSICHGIAAGYCLLRSLHEGYPAMGICLVWFLLAVLLCCKVK